MDYKELLEKFKQFLNEIDISDFDKYIKNEEAKIKVRQPMTNEQKIKELEDRAEDFKQFKQDLKSTNNWIKTQILSKDEKINQINKGLNEITEVYKSFVKDAKAEIEELKKPKCEIDNGGKFGINFGRITCFETASHREYYSKGMQIYLALAKFAEKYDPTEKYRAWEYGSAHWCVLKLFGEWGVAPNFTNYCPTTIYFSTKELAEAALQMLKDEKLIIV
jgi:hypothetical protein